MPNVGTSDELWTTLSSRSHLFVPKRRGRAQMPLSDLLKKGRGPAADLHLLSTDELWRVREIVSAILAKRIAARHRQLEDRLAALQTTAHQAKRSKKRRPYPPVLPKFANPDAPAQVWSGRGKQPLWVVKKLKSGLTLADLSIAPSLDQTKEQIRTSSRHSQSGRQRRSPARV